MKCQEVPQKLADEVKKAGLVDERGLMFMAHSLIEVDGKTSSPWADRYSR